MRSPAARPVVERLRSPVDPRAMLRVLRTAIPDSMTSNAMPSDDRDDGAARDRGLVVAALLAGGVGTRFGEAQPKQVLTLAGAPVLAHVFRRFDVHPRVSELVIPAHPTWRDDIDAIARSTIRETPWRLVDGGPTRNESVAAAVDALDHQDATVVVHDGARPLITAELIARTVDALGDHDAVLPVVPSTDPIVLVSNGGVGGFLDRRRLRRGQTPHVFSLSTLREMFTASPGKRAGTFSTLFELLLDIRPSARIRTVPGDERNLKITAPLDHLIAEQLLLVAEDDTDARAVVDFAETPGPEP